MNGIESAVFDLDADRHARAQGRMLDIHRDSGQAALHAAGLHEQFRAKVHPGGEALRVLDKHAHVLLEEKGFLAHRGTDGSLHVYAALRAAEDWLSTIDFTDTDAAKAALSNHFTDWASGLRNLIVDADGELIPRLIHALPVGHRWERVPGVTLLGDAAHLMSPFAGEGANLAMIDGADLGQALAAHPGNTEAALSAYEATLFERSEKSARESAQSLETVFNDRAPQPLVDMFASFAA
ncbi:FAD-dependent oxidoreductase [Streptosporangium sp. CA-115845]|uniref:FAD-dependent oxidoreductase n=1 Tax=Streptosporangium sp. CA-115845 TaxID=3240071 RepID=UPI003D923264